MPRGFNFFPSAGPNPSKLDALIAKLGGEPGVSIQDVSRMSQPEPMWWQDWEKPSDAFVRDPEMPPGVELNTRSLDPAVQAAEDAMLNRMGEGLPPDEDIFAGLEEYSKIDDDTAAAMLGDDPWGDIANELSGGIAPEPQMTMTQMIAALEEALKASRPQGPVR
jgi:hypothetical protein